MARRKYQKLTPEDEARHEKVQAMIRERIAYHEAKAIEQEAREEAARRAAEKP
jgi:hypothetical protein